MTEKGNLKWMKEKRYKIICILPEMYLFSRDLLLKHYRGRPPENIPELCNIDSCLKEYFYKAVDCHVRYTHSLHKFDPEFFSIATPKKGK